MKTTKEMAETMIDAYEWSIRQLSDISLYGPPTKHVYYLQIYGAESREFSMRTDLARLEHWRGVLNEYI